MALQSLDAKHLGLRSAEDVHDIFRRLGYDVYDPYPYEGNDLDELELDSADRDTVRRAYVVARLDNHIVYLFEAADTRQVRLRSLAWNALQRGTALLVVTRDYEEVVFVDPRMAGKPSKSNVRVNKLKVITKDPTRHDADTLNAIHAHHRTGQQVYDAQAEAFNVTTVTKRFYDEYRAHYEQARAAVRQHNKGIREFQNEDQSDKLHAFTQRLMGRLMFLYFLQRKGWLGGQQKFLTELYRRTMRQHAGEATGDHETFHYYREVLEPLFFETMNTKRPHNITRWENIRIPYLNGGLFDESRDPSGPILLPDSLFDPYSKDGLLAFFNRYNFTVADDTPLEQDVAVDPEMLGKVFENMLEERDRGQSGSFYTPRAIVSYMCQEALAGYLEESAGIPRETVRAQFDPDAELKLTPDEAERMNAALDTVTVLDPAVGSGSFLIGMLHEIIRLRRIAYVALHGTEDVPAAVLADWKEAIIRDTLYGVDIKPEAIEIAQLRLWLALVVDQTLEQARPLPNLDYKLMAGNSLIETIDGEPVLGEFAASVLQPKAGVDWQHVNDQLRLFDPNPVQGRMLLFDEEKAVEKERVALDKLRRDYFRASPDERRTLRAEITTQERRIVYASLKEKADKLQAQIDHYGKLSAGAGGALKPAEAKKLNAAVDRLARITQMQQDMAKPDYAPPFFLYHLHFSEVFERKGGFDIVVANPPYVKGDALGDQKRDLKATFTEVYAGRADLYVYFYSRGLDLLRKNGYLAFITANKWLTSSYGENLRIYLSENFNLEGLIDFGELPIFKEASTFPMIVLGQRRKKAGSFVVTKVQEWNEYGSDIYALVDKYGYLLSSQVINGADWTLTDNKTSSVLQKLELAGVPLGKVVKSQIYMGVKTGLNSAFLLTNEEKESLIAEDPHSLGVIKRYVTGDDIRKWKIKDRGQYLLYIHRGFPLHNYPAVQGRLEQFRADLNNRATGSSHAWYELQQPQTGIKSLFEKDKILYPFVAREPRFTLDEEGFYFGNPVYFISNDDPFLLAILNSSAVWLYIKANFACLGDPNNGGRFLFYTQSVEKIPIPNAPDVLRDQIAALARRCLDAAQSAPDTLPALEAELNALVYQAYGLDADDIAVIEEHLAGRGGASKEVSEDEE